MMSSSEKKKIDEIEELMGFFETNPALWYISSNEFRNKELKYEIITKSSAHCCWSMHVHPTNTQDKKKLF